MSNTSPLARRVLLSVVALFVFLSACNLFTLNPAVTPASPRLPGSPIVLVTADSSIEPTPTPFQPLISSPTPEPTPTPKPSPTLPLPTATITPVPTEPLPTPLPSDRTKYSLNVVLDYTNHGLSVDETILYTNQTGEQLDRLVLAVEPNRWWNCFQLAGLSVGGTVPDYRLEDHRLEIDLPQPLAPGGALTLTIQYSLSLPPKSFSGVFGYLGYQVNLKDWYPFVVPYIPGQGWILHDPGSVGEHLVYDAADFDVYIRQEDPSVKLIIAASAPGNPEEEGTRYHLENARTFAFSASTQFLVSTKRVNSIDITSYYFSGHQSAGKAVLKAVAQAISIFSRRFSPYPYKSLSIVETELPDGMEADGLVFLSSVFYDNYDGTVRGDLTTIGVHEVAHEWWFGMVGSDQALEPWLDEALALYSEHIFYEAASQGLVNWWWNYRVDYFAPSGWVDSTIYDFGHFRPYTDAVYLRGAEFLEDLRNRVGDKAFFDFLQDYATRFAHQRATAEDFFTLLHQHTDVDYSDIVNSYFKQYQ